MIINIKKKKFFFARVVRVKLPFIEVQDYSGKIQIYIKKKFNIGDIVFFFCKLKKNKKNIFLYYSLFSKLIVKNFLNIKNISFIKKFFCVNFFLIKYFVFFSFVKIKTSNLCKNKINSVSNNFKTYNFYKKKFFYLKISPELNIKKKLSLNYDRIFEITKCYRNEGITRIHNFEFLMIEYYIKNISFYSSIIFFELLFKNILISNSFYFIKIRKHNFCFNSFFKKVKILELLKLFFFKKKIKFKKKSFFYFLIFNNIKLLKSLNISNCIFKIYDNFIKKKKILPYFIKYFTSYSSVLSKNDFLNFNFVNRFEFYFLNFEISNGYDELNDYFLQKKKIKKKNKDFLYYMKNSFSNTVGVGIGLDRLIMIILNIFNIKIINF